MFLIFFEKYNILLAKYHIKCFPQRFQTVVLCEKRDYMMIAIMLNCTFDPSCIMIVRLWCPSFQLRDFGLPYIPIVQFWSIGFQLHDFDLLSITIVWFWCPSIPIVTIRTLCHCVVFNTKNLCNTCETDFTESGRLSAVLKHTVIKGIDYNNWDT